MRDEALMPGRMVVQGWWTGLARLALVCALAALPAAARALDVRVGVYANPPKVALAEGGRPSGILGDLLGEIAQREGWRLIGVPCEWEDCLAALEAGRIDLMPDVAYSDARAQIFDFHRIPALHGWSQVYAREGQRVRSMLDLHGKRIAVLDASVQMDYLSAALQGFGIRAQLVGVRSFDEAFAAVTAGRADVAVANHHFGAIAAPRYGLAESSLMFQPSRIFYATGKGRQPALRAAIDRHLEAWQADPKSPYFAVLSRWGTPEQAAPVPQAVWWGLGGLSALLLAALGMALLLRREVARRTLALRQSQEKLATILDSVEAYIFIKDTGLRYQYVNRKVAELFGRPAEEITGHGDDEFFDAASVERIRANDREVLEGGRRRTYEEENRTRSGEQRAFLSVKLPLAGPDGRPYALCGISTDITEQRQFLREIHELAYYDPLTHLSNRRQFMERLHRLQDGDLQAAPGHALLLVNLDNFKDVNDAYGAGTGDQLLRGAARRIAACARAGDLVARLGADEFAFLTGILGTPRATAVHQVEMLAAHIGRALSEAPFRIGGIEHTTSACIGVALVGEHGVHAETVLKQADLALSRAKAAGRGQVRFFRPDMEAIVAARAALEADLRRGLAGGQFLLHYQPQVDVDGRELGREALVRWQHPARGLVLPDSFIGLAEASGLIEPLGDWILRTACLQLVAWQADPATAGLILAVNMSARQVRQPDFAERVLRVATETGAPTNRLELELTESHLVEDLEGTVAKMNALRAQGVRISLDDFGTGYSSLNHLRRLPIDQLKIDQSFVRDILIDPTDLSIVRAVIEMGRSLGLEVLAEGVETHAQRDMLVELGCTRFQGYLFGRPAPLPGASAG